MCAAIVKHTMARTSMIETLHPSVLHCILCALPAASSVRFAACSKSLFQNIMISACHATRIPIVRERMKDACWSLLHAGYCVQVRNTLASNISCANQSRGVTFTCNPEMLHIGDDITDAHALYQRVKCHQIHVDDIKTFGEVFDRYIIHANARLQRSTRPAIRTIKIEKHFASCAEQLYRSQQPAHSALDKDHGCAWE